MKIVAITAYNRPTLLYSCLKNLSQAHKVEEWEIWISIDPSNVTNKIVSIIESFANQKLKVNFVVNDSRLGVRKNPYKLLQWCFGHEASLVLYLEDDVLVSSDCLNFSEVINKIPKFSSNYLCANLLTTTCNSHSVLCPPIEDYSKLKNILVKNKFFSSLGIILNKYQFINYFEPNWFNYPLNLRNFQGAETDGWDLAINDYLLSNKDLFVIQSIIPRISHKGIHGTHADYSFHQSAYSHVKIYEPCHNSLDTKQNQLSIKIIRREDVKTLEKLFPPYIKSYINMIHQFTDLQISSMEIENKLKNSQYINNTIPKHNDDADSEIQEFTLLQKRLKDMESRLNKKSIWIAEKVVSILNRLIGRNQ
ncbi:glycosyltransferase [Trichormus sp. NMC-1]|uniref:glycosyltransferase n=1 Tax=Trichormus sp. NMC-1 TaxID=1853259 RepID=UPI0008DC1249|nr:glycosyltransferase [Trichormus sp. NMC-1]